MVNIPPPPRIDDLFKVGDDGLYYDLSDLSTLFPDAAGTVPVTSDGDPSINIGYTRANYGDHPLYAGMDDSENLNLGPSIARVHLADPI